MVFTKHVYKLIIKEIFVKKFNLILIAVFFLCTAAGYSQFSFGVGTSLGSTGSYFGYQIDDFVPYIGLQYFNAGFTVEDHGMRYNNNGNLEPYIDKVEGSVAVFMPAIGAKYFIKHKQSIQAYVNASIFKPFISLTAESNGQNSTEVDKTNDNLSFIGFNAGFGVEYFLSNQFSLGGEFGLNMLFGSTETTSGNPTSQTDSYSIYKPKLDIGVTYGKITLNYYFKD
jgi:hypothetical protein